MIVIFILTYFFVGLASFFLLLYVQCSLLRTFVCGSFVLAACFVVWSVVCFQRGLVTLL